MIRNESKQTISVNSGFRLLQMVTELVTGWCVSKDVMLLRGWIVRSHIGWEREYKHFLKRCGNLSLVEVF